MFRCPKSTLLVFLFCFLYVPIASAGFFDDLIQKGKEITDEVTKVPGKALQTKDVLLTSGLKTRQIGLDKQSMRFTVEWIEWNSGFRGTELRCGDVIIGVNGASYATKKDVQGNSAIGQSSEDTEFRRMGLTQDGAQLTLAVERTGKTLEITGRLREKIPSFKDSKGQRLLSPNGPKVNEHDGFEYKWGPWYRDFVGFASNYLTHGLGGPQGTADSRKNFEENEKRKKRLAYLVSNYDGEFAQATLNDWKQLRSLLAGEVRGLTDDDLRYRQVGGNIVDKVHAAGDEAQAAMLAIHTPELIKPFPAVDPDRGDPSTVEGKIVKLESLTQRKHLSFDSGKPMFWAGDRNRGWYIIRETDSSDLYEAIQDYKANVSNKLGDSITLMGRITGGSKSLTVNDYDLEGLEVELLGASLGDPGFFLDFSNRMSDSNKLMITGANSQETATPLPTLTDTASPKKVMEAMIAYVKTGKRSSWEEIFANWGIFAGKITTNDKKDTVGSLEKIWGASRKSLFEDVYNVTVTKVSESRAVLGKLLGGDKKDSHVDDVLGLEGDELDVSTGPQIEEVTVSLDFVGRFGGKYRTFTKLSHAPRWTLQRVNGGPWRITNPPLFGL